MTGTERRADDRRTGRRHYSFAARPRAGVPARSRLVRGLKLVLPALAALLVTLLLAWPQLQWQEPPPDPEAFKLRPEDAGDLRMLNARYVGVDADNRPFTVTAEATRQSDAGGRRFELERPQADITLGDGAWVALMADRGVYDRETNTLSLAGDVQLFHDQGYQFRSQSARIDLKAGTAAGEDPVVAHGPAGVLAGEGFRIEDRGRRVLLTGHSTVQLNPGALKKTGAPEAKRK